MKKFFFTLALLLSFVAGVAFHYLKTFEPINGSTTLGHYYGISEDGDWAANVDVYTSHGEVMIRPTITCLNQTLVDSFFKDAKPKNHFIIKKENGLNSNGTFMWDDKKQQFFMLSYANDDGYYYDKILLNVGSFQNEIKLHRSPDEK